LQLIRDQRGLMVRLCKFGYMHLIFINSAHNGMHFFNEPACPSSVYFHKSCKINLVKFVDVHVIVFGIFYSAMNHVYMYNIGGVGCNLFVLKEETPPHSKPCQQLGLIVRLNIIARFCSIEHCRPMERCSLSSCQVLLLDRAVEVVTAQFHDHAASLKIAHACVVGSGSVW
jgi:hypothetical protein